MLNRNCYSVNGMTFILFHWSRFLLSESGTRACCPAFSLESCPAFDSSIGRVNYLTELEHWHTHVGPRLLRRRIHPEPALRRNPGAVGALPGAEHRGSSLSANEIRSPLGGLAKIWQRQTVVWAEGSAHNQKVGRYTIRVGFFLSIRSQSPTL